MILKHVPALVVNDKILVESMAICEYLDEAYPDVKLLPTDPFKRCDVRAVCEMLNAGIQPLQNLKIRQKIDEMGKDSVQWNKHWIEEGFKSK